MKVDTSCAFPSFVPNGNREVLIYVFLDWNSKSFCKGRSEILTSFLGDGSNSWTYISLRTATFFLKSTLPIIRSLVTTSSSICSIVGLKGMDYLGSKEKGMDTGSDTLEG